VTWFDDVGLQSSGPDATRRSGRSADQPARSFDGAEKEQSMIRPLADLPAGVIGFAADGKIRAEDYTQVLIPAIEQKVGAGEDIRVVLVFPSFDGLSADAAWQDLKLGIEHLTHWKRIALVTDVEWMAHLTRLFGWMTPGDVRHFPLADREGAITWAAGG
jgi:SpoIIAA-like